MKQKSYLDTESQPIHDYTKKNSYINNKDFDSKKEYNFLSEEYILLPEEYDIFSTLDKSFFTQKTTIQLDLISKCFNYMKKCLIDLYNKQDVICILPKLLSSQDEDGTITFSMVLSNLRAFLSFEGEKGDYDAYFGIVIHIDEDTISSETKKLTSENYEATLQLFLQTIIKNA